MDRRSFLRRVLGGAIAVAAGDVLLDKLCAAPVATIPRQGLFAATLTDDETRILDILEGPATLVRVSVHPSLDAKSFGWDAKPIDCRITRTSTGDTILAWQLHPSVCFSWWAAFGCEISVPRCDSLSLVAVTKQRGVEIAGHLASLEAMRL